MTPYILDYNQIRFIYIFTHLFYFSSVTFPKFQQQVSKVFTLLGYCTEEVISTLVTVTDVLNRTSLSGEAHLTNVP